MVAIQCYIMTLVLYQVNIYLSSGYNDDVLCYFTCPISGLGRIVMGRITNTGRVEIYNDTADTTVRVGYIPNELAFRIHTNWFID